MSEGWGGRGWRRGLKGVGGARPVKGRGAAGHCIVITPGSVLGPDSRQHRLLAWHTALTRPQSQQPRKLFQLHKLWSRRPCSTEIKKIFYNIARMTSVSVTKIRNSSGSSSTSSGRSGYGYNSRINSVTVRSIKDSHGSFTPLATYLSLKSVDDDKDTDDVTVPSIEIVSQYIEDSNELPPGTKIITHPMNGRLWTNDRNKTNDFNTKRQSRHSEDGGINDIVKRLQKV